MTNYDDVIVKQIIAGYGQTEEDCNKYEVQELRAKLPENRYCVEALNAPFIYWEEDGIRAMDNKEEYINYIEKSWIPSLKNEEIFKPCPLGWDEMSPDEQRKYWGRLGIEKVEVSNLGRVKVTAKNKNEQIAEQAVDRNCDLVLREYGSLKVYVLVAETWLGADEETRKWDIHHINNNAWDNRPENLIYLRRDLHSLAHGYGG